MAANLTASLNLADHILRVQGTDNNDTITISNSSGQISVAGVLIKVYNGDTTSTVANLDRSQMEQVEVKALAGNDTIRMSEAKLKSGQAVPTTIWGGDGNDTIVGGSQDDHLMGENGRDVVRGLGVRTIYSAVAAMTHWMVVRELIISMAGRATINSLSIGAPTALPVVRGTIPCLHQEFSPH